MANLLFIVQLAATLFMTGVIWVIQIVHYPLFTKVGRELFKEYELSHSLLITYVVLPPMFIEIGLAALALGSRPGTVPAWAAWLGFGLVVVIWLSTFFLQVPQHALLSSGFDANAHRLLVNTNWIRTVAWSVRSILLLYILLKMIQQDLMWLTKNEPPNRRSHL